MKKTYLKDYQAPAYQLPRTLLDIHVHGFDNVTVEARLYVKRNPLLAQSNLKPIPLQLDGENLTLLKILLNGKPLAAEDFVQNEEGLLLRDPPAVFELTTLVKLDPQANLTLAGLYVSGDTLCTQNEAQGFRRITYFLDRPDVHSVFTIRLRAPKEIFPTLLAGGEQFPGDQARTPAPAMEKVGEKVGEKVREKEGELEGVELSAISLEPGEHSVIYEDPFPKPAYLVAIVAGDLAKVTRSTTASDGRKILLELYMKEEDRMRGEFALDVLERAMRWDEKEFGLYYDLSVYRIVAVESFNFGAMENRGLNIFNAGLILADPTIATDEDYKRIETVVAHEYFHHWTGNRVTLRDWFQLTLKEGLTVYRDQEFTSDHHSRPVKRIEDMTVVRGRQFREDASLLAHPVRPEAYEQVDNFYTSTVYEKGAEIVRMLSILCGGPKSFHRLISKWLEHFDGQAVTVEDLLHYLEEATGKETGLRAKQLVDNGRELANGEVTRSNAEVSPSVGEGAVAEAVWMEAVTSAHWKQFARWYSTKGTPCVSVQEVYDENTGTLTVTCTQTIPNAKEALPLLIPLRWAAIDRRTRQAHKEGVMLFGEAKQTMTLSGFGEFASRPYLSLGRGFSAPIRLVRELSFGDWLEIVAIETDPIMRWDALQQSFMALFRLYYQEYQTRGGTPQRPRGSGTPGEGSSTMDSTTSFSNEDSIMFADLVEQEKLDRLWEFLREIIEGEKDLAYASKCLTLGEPQAFFTEMSVLDFSCVRAFERVWYAGIAEKLQGPLETRVHALGSENTVAGRALRHVLLKLLVRADHSFLSLAETIYAESVTMSDRLAAFNLLVRYGEDMLRERVVTAFYEEWKHVSLVMNKWFAAQSMIEGDSVLTRIDELSRHPAYKENEPSKVYALWGTFAFQNIHAFNHHSGAGYRALGEMIVHLDHINPSVSARLLTAYQHVRQLLPPLKVHGEAVLDHLRGRLVSKNTKEVIDTFTR